MKSAQRRVLSISSAFVLLALPSVAQAHVGIGSTTGFFDGFVHPVSGLDHICAMLGVGLWAAQRGGRAAWMIPLVFVSVMMVGGALGMAHVFIPFVEPAINISVLIVGLLVTAAVRMPLAASACLVGLFALFHGHAHGMEMPATAAGIAYGVGFVATTVSLLACGIGLEWAAEHYQSRWITRYAGAAMIVCGVGLCAMYVA